MRLQSILTALDTLAPLRHAAPWDNVGLLCGDPEQNVSVVLCCIDLTPAVLGEARDMAADLVVSYHPPLFKPIGRLPHDHVVVRAWREGRAVYSPHTALDVAEGGTNDVLAEAVGLTQVSALRPSEAAVDHRLVVFVPAQDANCVAAALFAAGAGRMGAYSQCSFASAGTGAFFGEPGSTPAVGAAGQRTEVAEVRLETVVPPARLAAVLAALRAAHPYEEPAFDVFARVPTHGEGLGRVGTLPTPLSLAAFAARAKASLGLDHVLVAEPEAARPLARVALCAGAGGELIGDALAARADVFLTGELRHHDALRLRAAGVAAVSTLHSNSERAALAPLARNLAAAVSGVSIRVSERDRDPLHFV